MSNPVFAYKQAHYYSFNCDQNHCQCFHYIYTTIPPLNQSDILKTRFFATQLIYEFLTFLALDIKTFLNECYFIIVTHAMALESRS